MHHGNLPVGRDWSSLNLDAVLTFLHLLQRILGAAVIMDAPAPRPTTTDRQALERMTGSPRHRPMRSGSHDSPASRTGGTAPSCSCRSPGGNGTGFRRTRPRSRVIT